MSADIADAIVALGYTRGGGSWAWGLEARKLACAALDEGGGLEGGDGGRARMANGRYGIR